MKKKNIALLGGLIFSTIALCSSCTSSTAGVQINTDGTTKVNEETLIEKNSLDTAMLAAIMNPDTSKYVSEAQKMLKNLEIVTIDGVSYYKSTEEKKCTYKEAEKYLTSYGFSGAKITKDHAYLALYTTKEQTSVLDLNNLNIIDSELQSNLGLTTEQAKQILENSKLNISVTFPEAVTYTNAQDMLGNTLYWTFDSDYITSLKNGLTTYYGETTTKDAIAADKTAPTIKGISNNKYFKSGSLKLSDSQTGIAAVVANGEAVTNKTTLKSICKQGKNTITVYDFSGNKKTIRFYFDTNKPAISGIKNNKTYKKAVTIKFKDSYGIKSAKLNGKSIKTGKKVSKKGSYTLKVTDKAGNTSTIKFKIKK